MKFAKIIKLLFSVIVCEVAGASGAIFTTPQIAEWYATLNKPFFNPPNWIFAPVWTALFALIGVSLYLVWERKWEIRNEICLPENRKINGLSEKFLSGAWKKANIVLIFIVQFALNVLWSYIFFGSHNIGAAFFELIMLWVAIVFTIVNFYRVSKVAAVLLLPYIIWVSFAGILNFSIWMLNI